jgi:hypothetical protein
MFSPRQLMLLLLVDMIVLEKKKKKKIPKATLAPSPQRHDCSIRKRRFKLFFEAT